MLDKVLNYWADYNLEGSLSLMEKKILGSH